MPMYLLLSIDDTGTLLLGIARTTFWRKNGGCLWLFMICTAWAQPFSNRALLTSRVSIEIMTLILINQTGSSTSTITLYTIDTGADWSSLYVWFCRRKRSLPALALLEKSHYNISNRSGINRIVSSNRKNETSLDSPFWSRVAWSHINDRSSSWTCLNTSQDNSVWKHDYIACGAWEIH